VFEDEMNKWEVLSASSIKGWGDYKQVFGIWKGGKKWIYLSMKNRR